MNEINDIEASPEKLKRYLENYAMNRQISTVVKELEKDYISKQDTQELENNYSNSLSKTEDSGYDFSW